MNLLHPLTLVAFLPLVSGCSYADSLVAPFDVPVDLDWNFKWKSGNDNYTLEDIPPGIPDWCVGIVTDDPACWIPPGE